MERVRSEACLVFHRLWSKSSPGTEADHSAAERAYGPQEFVIIGAPCPMNQESLRTSMPASQVQTSTGPACQAPGSQVLVSPCRAACQRALPPREWQPPQGVCRTESLSHAPSTN